MTGERWSYKIVMQSAVDRILCSNVQWEFLCSLEHLHVVL